jgi:hypothetical protein
VTNMWRHELHGVAGLNCLCIFLHIYNMHIFDVFFKILLNLL